MPSFQLMVWINGEVGKHTTVAIRGSGFAGGQDVVIKEDGGNGEWKGTIKAKDVSPGGTIAVLKVKCHVESTNIFSEKTVETPPPDDLIDVDVTVDGTSSTDVSEVIISEEP